MAVILKRFEHTGYGSSKVNTQVIQVFRLSSNSSHLTVLVAVKMVLSLDSLSSRVLICIHLILIYI